MYTWQLLINHAQDEKRNNELKSMIFFFYFFFFKVKASIRTFKPQEKRFTEENCKFSKKVKIVSGLSSCLFWKVLSCCSMVARTKPI